MWWASGSMEESLNSSIIDSRRRAPVSLALMSESRSPRTSTGLRELARMIADQLLVQHAFLAHLHVRNERAFLEGGIGLGGHADAAHIDDMAGGGEEGDELPCSRKTGVITT